jgi:hypothetical protein
MDHHPLSGTKIPNLLWFDKFLKAGEEQLGFGKYGERNYRWLIDNDLRYAQWVVMENAQMPRLHHDPFAKAAKWLAEAFPIMQHPDMAFLESFEEVAKAAKQKAHEEECERMADKRALKALRKSTANGQLALLPPELLMHILKARKGGHQFVVTNPILNLPQVCQELRRMLGPLEASSARMTLMIADTFALMDPIKSKIVGGTSPNLKLYRKDACHIGGGVPDDLHYQRLWRHMKILASKTLIDLECTQLGVVRGSLDDYQALAVRSVAQKDAFLKLREQALGAFRRMKKARFDCNDFLRAAYYTGATSDDGAAFLDIIKKERQSVVNDLKKMEKLNKEHSLRLNIPGMFKTEAGERKLLHFLNPLTR